MIKILIPGKKKKISCNECGAMLSYEPEDIQEKNIEFPKVKTFHEKYITCPQCYSRIIIEASR